MRPAPLPALLLLLAVPAAACPYGPRGHFHPSFAEASAAGAPALPTGRCAGTGAAPALPAGDAAPFDLKASPVPAEQRVHWTSIGFSFDDAAGRVKRGTSTVTAGEVAALTRPFDASWQKMDTYLWIAFALNGYRLDESDCRIKAPPPDARPVDEFTMLVWKALQARQMEHGALESLLADLRGLDPSAPVPESARAAARARTQAGAPLPPELRALLERNGTTVADLKKPALKSYSDLTAVFDGQRSLADVVAAAGAGGAASPDKRRRPMEAAERALGRQVADAFAAELSRHAPGRELLAKFPPPAGPPDMYVLKLTQNPNDPNQPGALYDASGDRMVFNHWDIVRVLQMKLPPERMKAIEGRAADVGLLSALFKEDPSLLRVLVDALDVNYFHELKHAEQARRGRLEIEQMRGNLPFANPLSKEHEAYREECRYLVSKGGSALVDSPFAQRCLMMLKDPDAHRDWITNLYVSNYNGFGTVDDVASRQEVRREAARASGEGWAAWGRRKLREAGLARGDEALAAYRAAELEREKAFLAAVPDLRRRGAEAVVAAHLSAGRYGEAFAAAKSLPHGTAEDHDKRLAGLADKAAAWIARDKAPGGRDARLNAAGAVGTYFNETGRPWPPAMIAAYEADARSMVEELLAKALEIKEARRRPGGMLGKIFVQPPFERSQLLDRAESWLKALSEPGDLPARIEKARKEALSAK